MKSCTFTKSSLQKVNKEVFGCPECKKGFRGRIGIYEIFVLDESIQNLIYQLVDAGVIRRRAVEIGMKTLREDGILKAAAGITSISEVLRLTVDS